MSTVWVSCGGVKSEQCVNGCFTTEVIVHCASLWSLDCLQLDGRQMLGQGRRCRASVCQRSASLLIHSSFSVWASDRRASLPPSAWLHPCIPLCSSRWSIRFVSQAGIGVHASPHTFACVVVRSHACILRLCTCTYGCVPFSPVDFAIPSQATVWPALRPAG